MRRILYLHANAELYGSDLILFQLVTHLDSRRYQPLVILPCEGPLVRLLEDAGVATRIEPLAVLRRALMNPRGVLRFGAFLARSIGKLRSIIVKEGVSIVHTNTGAVWGGELAALSCGVPHVVSVMEIVESPVMVAAAMSWMTSTLSDRVITVSKAVKEHFLKYTPWAAGKYVELFPPVDTGRFSPNNKARQTIRSRLGIDEKTILVGMAGRLNNWKGQEIFVRACKKVLENVDQRIDLHFVVLGSPVPGREEFERELHKEIEQLGLSGKVTAPGFQPNIQEWLSAMDVFVLPSKLPEPSSTGVVAAMAMGLPVVGTNIGGTPETVLDGQTGLLVSPSDPLALAEKISLLAENENLRKTLGKNAMDRARNLYSIETYARNIMTLYDELLDRR
jgi:glycosyltransferase involved in cell wall biosynthesis